MAYIGRSPQVGNYSKLDSIAASFNTSDVTFNLTTSGVAFTANQPTQLIISIDGVIQEPSTAYTVSGSTITFTSAPATGASFFGIALGDTLDIGVPSDGTVNGAKLASGAVSANTKLAATVVTAHAVADNAVTTRTVADSSITYNKLNANTAHVDRVTSNYTKQHQYTLQTLTPSGNTIAWDLNTSPVAKVTLNADNFVYTINAPSNMVAGGTYLLKVDMGASAGSGTKLSWNGNTAPYAFAGNTYPTTSANTGATDIVSFFSDGTYMYGSSILLFGKN